jgi:hypothetical protein
LGGNFCGNNTTTNRKVIKRGSEIQTVCVFHADDAFKKPLCKRFVTGCTGKMHQ